MLLTIVWHGYHTSKLPHLTNEYGQLVYSRLDFFFGPLLENLVNKNEYFFSYLNQKMYLARMPLIPFFLDTTLTYVTKSYLGILIIKNFILISLVLFFLKKFFKKNILIFISLIILFYNPYNTFTIVKIIPEESFISIFMLILFLSLSLHKKPNFILIGILITLIYLTKASTLFFCYFLSIFLVLIYKSKESFLPFILVLCAYLLWASNGYNKTGKFVSPFSISSISGLTLSAAYDEDFLKIYPRQSPDILLDKIIKKNKEKILESRNEHELDKIFKDEVFSKIISDKKFLVKSFLRKLYVLLINIKFDAQILFSDNYDNIRFTEIPNKIFFNISLLLLMVSVINNKKFEREDYYYIIFIIFYLLPYIIGFLYTRHMVPLYIVSNFYIFLKYLKYKKLYE
tara:strand:+ start:1034 stop:2233 length:1200 start_codon:yes stop_codon:yes gene_type:complete